MALTALEERVVHEWRALPYHGFGLCANPGCKRPVYCCGKNPLARVCISCFEFVYDCKAPTMRKH
jgi:hypothetical protein